MLDVNDQAFTGFVGLYPWGRSQSISVAGTESGLVTTIIRRKHTNYVSVVLMQVDFKLGGRE